jgi:predicted small secreted protein
MRRPTGTTDQHDASAIRHPGEAVAASRPGGFTMRPTPSRLTAGFFALVLIGLLAACNTTEGMGKDLSAVGDAVSDSAEENKGY